MENLVKAESGRATVKPDLLQESSSRETSIEMLKNLGEQICQQVLMTGKMRQRNS